MNLSQIIKNTFLGQKIFGHWKPFKINEKYFLFHLKSSFHPQDNEIFVWIFSSCKKPGLIRKITFFFNIHDITNWATNSWNTHIYQYLKTSRQPDNEIWETTFLKNHTQRVVQKLFADLFLKDQNWAYLWINSLMF